MSAKRATSGMRSKYHSNDTHMVVMSTVAATVTIPICHNANHALKKEYCEINTYKICYLLINIGRLII